MKTVPAIKIAAAVVAGLFLLEAIPGHTEETKLAGAVPKSLDKYYPPKDKKRTYTLEMLELGRLLGSLTIAARSCQAPDDRAKMNAEVAAFVTQYDKVAAMVPEWKPYFPPAPVANLKKTVADMGDARNCGTAVKDVEATCTRCHMREMFKVQAIHHWPKFAHVATVDPKGVDVPFHDTMIELSNRMGALPTAVERGDWDAAKVHQKEMLAQFNLLESSCENCHSEPRAYFVDRQVKGEILKMNGLIKRQTTDLAEYRKLTDNIHQRSCIPCHQVHMPAAYMQMQLEP